MKRKRNRYSRISSLRDGELRPLPEADFSRPCRRGFLAMPAGAPGSPEVLVERYLDLSCLRAYSSILTRRMRSVFRFSTPRLSPSRSAMRACGKEIGRVRYGLLSSRKEGLWHGTYPHLGSLNLPLVPVLFVPPPLALEVVEDARKRILCGRERGAGLV